MDAHFPLLHHIQARWTDRNAGKVRASIRKVPSLNNQLGIESACKSQYEVLGIVWRAAAHPIDFRSSKA